MLSLAFGIYLSNHDDFTQWVWKNEYLRQSLNLPYKGSFR